MSFILGLWLLNLDHHFAHLGQLWGRLWGSLGGAFGSPGGALGEPWGSLGGGLGSFVLASMLLYTPIVGSTSLLAKKWTKSGSQDVHAKEDLWSFFYTLLLGLVPYLGGLAAELGRSFYLSWGALG